MGFEMSDKMTKDFEPDISSWEEERYYLSDSIRHSNGKIEYDLGQSKLTYYQSIGKSVCSRDGCNHIFKLYDRVVSIKNTINKRENSYARLYCIECARMLNII